VREAFDLLRASEQPVCGTLSTIHAIRRAEPRPLHEVACCKAAVELTLPSFKSNIADPPCRDSDRAQTRTPLHLGSARNQQLRPRRRPLRLLCDLPEDRRHPDDDGRNRNMKDISASEYIRKTFIRLIDCRLVRNGGSGPKRSSVSRLLNGSREFARNGSSTRMKKRHVRHLHRNDKHLRNSRHARELRRHSDASAIFTLDIDHDGPPAHCEDSPIQRWCRRRITTLNTSPEKFQVRVAGRGYLTGNTARPYLVPWHANSEAILRPPIPLAVLRLPGFVNRSINEFRVQRREAHRTAFITLQDFRPMPEPIEQRLPAHVTGC